MAHHLTQNQQKRQRIQLAKQAVLQQTLAELETKVQERTWELQKTIAQLEQEITERSLTEAKLRASETELQALLAAMNDIVMVLDSEGRYLKIAPTNPDLLYKPSEEVIGKTMHEIWPSEQANLFLNYIRDVLATGQTATIEYSLMIGDRIFWFETSISPLAADRVISIARDITTRKQAQAALQQANEELEDKVTERTAELRQAICQLQQEIAYREQTETALTISEQRYRSLIAATTQMVWTANANGLGVASEDIASWQAYTGQSQAEFQCLGWLEAVHQDDRDRTLKIWLNALETKKSFQTEYRLRNQNGYYRHFSVRGVPVFNTDGSVREWIGTCTDIHEHKKAEAALAASEAKFRRFVEDANDIIFSLTLEGVFTYVSPRWTDILGHNAKQIPGQHYQPFIHPEDLPWTKAFLDQVAKTGQKDGGFEFRAKRVDGSWCWMTVNSSPLKDANGNLFAFLGIARDITERKLVEQTLRQQAEREQLLNCLVSQIRNSLDFDTIVTTMVREIHNFLQIDRCAFCWYNSDAESPYWEIVKEARCPSLPDCTGRYLAADMGDFSQRLLQLETIRVDDVETVNNPEWKACMEAWQQKSILLIPMQSHLGAISLLGCGHSKTIRPWKDDEVELLKQVMEQLAIALNQAELYTQSRTKAEELEATLKELHSAQSQLIQSEKMSSLGQLVAGVAHEINNPTSFIYGNITHADGYISDMLSLIKLYQKNYPHPGAEIQKLTEEIDLEFLVQDLPKLLDSMKMGADRIQKIVASLRTFSRMDEAEFKAVNIHEGIDSTLTILQHRLKAQPNRPEIQALKQYGNLPLIECYAGQLNQVFMNILSNGIDALEEGHIAWDMGHSQDNLLPKICIRTEIIGDLVAIEIVDNGPGMTPNVRQRLFDPFFTTKPVGKGTGMGLSISYQIITERHKGSLDCISSPGNGAKFLIKIPLRQ